MISKKDFKMSEILLCNQSLSPQNLQNQYGISIDQISAFSCKKPTTAAANTPYIIGNYHTGASQSILSQLSPSPVAKELTNLSLSYGGDNVMALSEITAKLKDYNIGLMGASTSVYANRVGGFASAVKEYQDALMAYRSAINSNSAAKSIAKQKALKAFQNLQFRFKHELNAINAGVKARRGTPLSSATRATNIARSSRNVEKLNVTSQVQAHNLVKFTQHAKVLGNGLAVIDFTSRVGNIHNEYKAGGEWERELFIESSSFAASAVAGTIAVKTGLAILMVATPVGWVGLIAGGVAVAGAAAATSMATNYAVKKDAGGLYDSIMRWISAP